MSNSPSKSKSENTIFYDENFLIVEKTMNNNNAAQHVKSNDTAEVRYFILLKHFEKTFFRHQILQIVQKNELLMKRSMLE